MISNVLERYYIDEFNAKLSLIYTAAIYKQRNLSRGKSLKWEIPEGGEPLKREIPRSFRTIIYVTGKISPRYFKGNWNVRNVAVVHICVKVGFFFTENNVLYNVYVYTHR